MEKLVLDYQFLNFQVAAKQARSEWRSLTGLIYLLMALLVPYFINYTIDVLSLFARMRLESITTRQSFTVYAVKNQVTGNNFIYSKFYE